VQQLESFQCLCGTLVEVIEEHRSAKELLLISDHLFLRVEKNLQTILSWGISVKNQLESRLRMIETCLSTVIIMTAACLRTERQSSMNNSLTFGQLSTITSLKNDRAVSKNTDYMARLAEYSREENISMGNMARAAKLDSEAMKTIAIMTMLYLPATFTAVSPR